MTPLPPQYDDGMFVCGENLDSVCCGLAACMSGFNGVAPPAGSAMRLTDRCGPMHDRYSLVVTPPDPYATRHIYGLCG